MNRCDACQHFEPLKHATPSYILHGGKGGRVGRCEVLTEGTDRFQYQAGYYAASLDCYVREDFGCAEWERRP